MKIYPDLQKIWAKRIRDAGMTSNQARKVLEESNKSNQIAEEFAQAGGKPKSQKFVQNLLKRINIF